MTFEEFFKKKKIDLVLLQAAEPALFAEFESHYTQMGEKSFDHTKKYWFNNLRRLYHTPEEIKVEKVKIENPLAEQTVTEAITEKTETPPAPKVGFTPRFKARATKPAEESPAVAGIITNNSAPEIKPSDPATAEPVKPKVGFTPRFKAGATKSGEEAVASESAKEDSPVASEETPKPKVGFTPRFKAGVTKPAEETAPEPPKEDPTLAVEQETSKPKVGFTPRFKAGVTKPKREE